MRHCFKHHLSNSLHFACLTASPEMSSSSSSRLSQTGVISRLSSWTPHALACHVCLHATRRYHLTWERGARECLEISTVQHYINSRKSHRQTKQTHAHRNRLEWEEDSEMTDFISTANGLRQLQGLRVYWHVPDTKSQCISLSRMERENHTQQCVVAYYFVPVQSGCVCYCLLSDWLVD